MQTRFPLLFVALASTAALTAEAMAKAPRYAMKLDDATPEHGVQVVSLVAKPAIERGWVALSAVEPTTTSRFHLSTATDGPTKQVLTGPALLPGQEILRLNAAGEPFYITFDSTTIEASARRFASQGHHNSTNQDHALALEGNVIYESWIVADPEKDKAAALGLDVPAGTWMLSVHIPDADYWQNEVVSGNKTGFSIEGLFAQENLNLSAVQPAPTPMPDKKWYSGILARLSKLAPEKATEMRAALGLEQLADGRSVNIDDTTGAVTVVDAEGNSSALPDGSYPLANGGQLVVAAGVRQDGEGQPADLGTEKQPTAAAPAAEPLPAPLPETASIGDLVKAFNDLLASQGGEKKVAENPATAPVAPKLAEVLHKVALADVGAKLAELKLDAIELEDGGQLTYNAITRQLTDKSGALVKSGYFAAKDGSYFSVSTDQYIYEISKPTYDSVYLQEVALSEANAKLAKTPAAGKVRLGGEATTAGATTTNTVQSRAQLRLQRVEATR